MDLNRLSKSAFGRPTPDYSCLCGTVSDTEYFGKVSQTTSDAANGKKAIISRVAGLFSSSGPTAISRFVIAIVVDAVNRLANGALAHIGKKILELIPSFTNTNSSAPIVFVLRNMFVSAPGTHTCPTSVSRSFSRDTMAVPDRCSVSFYQASTRLGCSTTNIGIQNNYVFTAITNTKAGTSVTARGINKIKSIFKNFKLSRPLSNDGYFGRHCIVFLSALFSSGRWATTHARCDLKLPVQPVNT